MEDKALKLNIKTDTQEIVITNTLNKLQYMTPYEIAAVLENLAQGLRTLPEIPIAELSTEDKERLDDIL